MLSWKFTFRYTKRAWIVGSFSISGRNAWWTVIVYINKYSWEGEGFNARDDQAFCDFAGGTI